MHRKQAKFFGKLHPKFQPPCYLKIEEKQQFQSQFTLFDQEIDLKKLKQTMQHLGYPKNDPMVYEFISQLCDKNEKEQSPKINFHDYLKAIDKKMSPAHKQSLTMFRLLAGGSSTIDSKQFLEIMKEIGDKQFTIQEAHELMSMVIGRQTTEITQDEFVMILQKRANYYGL